MLDMLHIYAYSLHMNAVFVLAVVVLVVVLVTLVTGKQGFLPRAWAIVKQRTLRQNRRVFFYGLII